MAGQVYLRPFHVQAATVNLAVTSSSQTLAINSTAIGVRSIRIANVGTQTVFVAFGTSSAAATTTTSMPLLANSVETFLLQQEVTHVAAIAASTGSTIYVTVGEGA